MCYLKFCCLFSQLPRRNPPLQQLHRVDVERKPNKLTICCQYGCLQYMIITLQFTKSFNSPPLLYKVCLVKITYVLELYYSAAEPCTV